MPSTLCNPLPLPDYPRGVFATAKHKKSPTFWLDDERRDFRETADPTVVWDEEKERWLLFASGDLAYVSNDGGASWRKHPVTPPFVGYAPTVEKVGGTWWLTGSGHGIYTSSDPLGPYVFAGDVRLPDGSPLPSDCGWLDPMIFSDDDGRVYAYWGIRTGIFGAELDPGQPGRLLGAPLRLFGYDPSHEWERGGRFHQHDESCLEGAWMLKHNGRYWLTYSAPGTNPMYCMGAYVGSSPLGPFSYASKNPVLDGRGGRFVQGAGHGSIVRGPRGTLWAFYTCHVQIHHAFERRIGMDPAGFDEEGNLFVVRPSDTPQFAAGIKEHPESGNLTGWQPVSHGESARASSHAPGREARFAIDLNPQTWWQAAETDTAPWLEIDLYRAQSLRALRLHWKEPGLDYDNGVPPVPMRWRLLGRASGDAPWRTLLDRSDNGEDWLIEYHELPEGPPARFVRLEVARHPGAIGVGLLDCSLFAAV